MQTYKEVFNDGLLKYGHKVTQRSETGKRIGDVFNAEGQLYYRELSYRESDYKLANTMGTSLDLKVKTLYPPSFRRINKNKLIVSINGMEYEVIKVDHDQSKLYLYFYLAKVGGHGE
jgi:hypothetical protein